jgi:hypothetical protein
MPTNVIVAVHYSKESRLELLTTYEKDLLTTLRKVESIVKTATGYWTQ